MLFRVVATASGFAFLAVLGPLGCAFDSSGSPSQGGDDDDDTTGQDSGSETGATTPPTSTTIDVTSTAGTTTDDETTTGACTPGEESCSCNAGACDEALVCVEDTCVLASCGDGVVQRNEDCEPALDSHCGADCHALAGPRSLALGHEHTCAVTEDKRLRCWGSGQHGRTGLGTTDDVGAMGPPSRAADVDAGGSVDRVVLGTSFSCALREGGTVVCWGLRADGRLGDGDDDGSQNIGDDRGETGATLGALEIPGIVRDLSLGGVHACALTDSPFAGSVYCWGMAGNSGAGQGRLGYGILENIGEINTPASVGPVSLPADVDVRSVAAGAGHTCVLDAAGDVYCWGDGVNGVLGTMSAEPIGDDETAAAATPVLLGGVAIAISAGSQHTCALIEGGDVRCWGFGDLGRLGIGNTDVIGDDEPPSDVTVELGAAAVAVAAGRAHSCALLVDGTLRCWGDGARGKLGQGDDATIGDNEQVNEFDPVVVDEDPEVNVIAVDVGGDHTCVVLDHGGVRCWGRGDRGQLGLGSTDDVGVDEVPADVALVDFDGG